MAQLRVLSNPYSADVDHEGRLHAHVSYEPDWRTFADVGIRYIGCRLAAKKLRDADPTRQLTEDWDHWVEYSPEVTVLPVTAYYLRLLMHRDILPADAETHALAFGSSGGFVDPMKRLAQFAQERGVIPAPQDVWEPLLKPQNTFMQERSTKHMPEDE